MTSTGEEDVARRLRRAVTEQLDAAHPGMDPDEREQAIANGVETLMAQVGRQWEGQRQAILYERVHRLFGRPRP